MGALTSRVFAALFGTKEMFTLSPRSDTPVALNGHGVAGIMMIGLDAAGKTTILYKLKLDKVETTIPTIGFNIETVQHHNIEFTIWDVGGQDKIRPLWRSYFHDKQAFIFVIDSNDVERLDEAAQELEWALATIEERTASESTPVLVLANKQDLPHAVGVDELRDRLKLRGIRQPCHVQATCATTGDGLYEGLDWLANALR